MYECIKLGTEQHGVSPLYLHPDVLAHPPKRTYYEAILVYQQQSSLWWSCRLAGPSVPWHPQRRPPAPTCVLPDTTGGIYQNNLCSNGHAPRRT